MKNKKENFFEFVPVKVNGMDWKKNKDEVVQLIVWKDKIIDKIVRKFFDTPEKTIVDLDEIGSFVWESIDGNRNIFEISQLMKDNFGKKVEPLNERLITYIKILKNNKFIKLVKKQEA